MLEKWVSVQEQYEKKNCNGYDQRNTETHE